MNRATARRAAIGLVCLAGLAAASFAAPTSTAPAEPKTVSIEIVKPDAPAILVSGREKPVKQAELVTILKDYRASLKEGAKTEVAIKADPEVAYSETSRVILACHTAGIGDITIDGEPIHLPAAPILAADKTPTMEVRLRIKLYNVGASGQYEPEGKNDHCTIMIGSEPFGDDFGALRRALIAKRTAGLDTKAPVLVQPTDGCLHKYAMQAYAAAKEAGFSNIQFVISYEVSWPSVEKKNSGPGAAKKADMVPTKTDGPGSGRGKFKPGPSSTVRQFTENPPPDTRPNNTKTPDDRGFFGVGGGKEGPRKIVYVVDRSGSMTDSIDFVQRELKRSIGALTDEQEFHVIFYSSGPPVEMPTRRLVPATERNKQLAGQFIDGIVPQGETDPSKALERAFACEPEAIYLLTDGEFDREIVALVKKLNADKKVKVHTIGFLYVPIVDVLKEIAEQNGGEHKYVTEKDLANLTK